MGQGPSIPGLNLPGQKKGQDDKKKKKWQPPQPTRIGRKPRKAIKPVHKKLPTVAPLTKCKLRQLRLQRIQDYLLMEREFVTNQENIKPAHERNQADMAIIEKMRGSHMEVGTLEELIDDNHGIVSSPGGPKMYVGILSFVDRDQIEPGCTVLLKSRGHQVVGLLPEDNDSRVDVMKVDKAPLETYADVGGLADQIQEVKEAVELPLSHPEMYDDMGIKPPKGVIFYGPPGTGKTLLARAVASETSASFLRVVGSELIQKYLGEGPKLVRQLFTTAQEMAPSIIFIDEIDAVGTKRYDSNSGGQREIQRTMLELLNQLDGFDSMGEVKVIMATNRIETLDPALLRPGRIDRKIEFPLPDTKTKRRIFTIHTKKMAKSSDVDIEEFVMAKDDLSGADIKAICTEAGLLALRERRLHVTQADFRKAKEVALYRKKGDVPEGLYL
ncbi:MAG: ATPase of 26S proteasome regulatory subunit 4 [Cercozoa sp. M6MM]